MCGILALLGPPCPAQHAETLEQKSQLKDLEKRSKRQRHRGPDYVGFYHSDHGDAIVFHERLAIVDPESGEQPIIPLCSGRKIVLGVNGEIYNHAQLAASLDQHTFKTKSQHTFKTKSQHTFKTKSQHTFKTKSDCEIITHLYEQVSMTSSPEDSHDRIEAMLNQLNGMFSFVLIDEDRGTFLIARDHIGIIPLYYGYDQAGRLWVGSELKTLHDVCPDHHDIFPPGHYWYGTFRPQTDQSTILSKDIRPWYRPTWFGPISSFSDPSQLRERLEQSVQGCLMSDVPYGVLLSGGLDSSLIASMVCRLADRAPETIDTFAIGLEDSPDLARAREVAQFLGTRHHEFIFTIEEGLAALHDVIYHLETYDQTTVRASVPMYLLSKRIRDRSGPTPEIKMVLSGEGSDEVFAGYLYFHRAPSPSALQEECKRKVLALHQYDCLRANKSAAAWGLEVRVPYLDRIFLDYAMNLDPELKMCTTPDGQTKIEKHLLRAGFDTPEQPYLPDSVLWRQKEQLSDGVGYGWIDALKDYAAARSTPEKDLYREIFERYYPRSHQTVPEDKGSVACSSAIAAQWDPKWDLKDPSGRSVKGVHQDGYGA